MVLDIPLCRTIKGQKSISFLGPKIWNKVSLNIKTAATTSSFTHPLKKEILSKLQERAILLIFYNYYYYYSFFLYFFGRWFFFNYIICVHTSSGTLIEIRFEIYWFEILSEENMHEVTHLLENWFFNSSPNGFKAPQNERKWLKNVIFRNVWIF